MRLEAAAVALGHDIYSFGGWKDSDNDSVKDGDIVVFVLNTETLQWRQVRFPVAAKFLDFRRESPW